MWLNPALEEKIAPVGNSLRTYLALCWLAGEEKSFILFPSKSRLKALTGRSSRSIERALKHLQAEALIGRIGEYAIQLLPLNGQPPVLFDPEDGPGPTVQ